LRLSANPATTGAKKKTPISSSAGVMEEEGGAGFGFH